MVLFHWKDFSQGCVQLCILKKLSLYFLLGVESKFGTSVNRLEWLEDQNMWSLIGLDGQNLGQFKGVVATDKNIVSPRFTSGTGRQPPLGNNALLQAFYFYFFNFIFLY